MGIRVCSLSGLAVVVTALATAGAIALANYEGGRMHHATEIIERPAAAAAAE